MSFWGKNKKATTEDAMKFSPTRKIGNYIWFDEDNQLLMISTKVNMKPKYLLRSDNILGYSTFQDEKEVIKNNGVGRAVIGGALFGATGAIVGAVTASSKNKQFVKNLWITLELDGVDTEKKTALIPFIIMSKTDTSSNSFKNIEISLEESVLLLDSLISSRNK